MEFEEEYARRAKEGEFEVIDAGVRLYDVMWILATALNNTMTAVESGDINGTGCEGLPGSMVPLEQFSYSNERMGCVIEWNLQQTNFSGVSVSISGKGGREGGRERGREGGEGGREGRRVGGKESWEEGGREGGRKRVGRREGGGGRERGQESGDEGGRVGGG
jgi:hypothetical protein